MYKTSATPVPPVEAIFFVAYLILYCAEDPTALSVVINCRFASTLKSQISRMTASPYVSECFVVEVQPELLEALSPDQKPGVCMDPSESMKKKKKKNCDMGGRACCRPGSLAAECSAHM